MKSEYVHHKAISGAIGVKLCATGIEKAVAGTPIMVIGPEDDEEDIKEEVRPSARVPPSGKPKSNPRGRQIVSM